MDASVLIIDDDASFANAFAKMLEKNYSLENIEICLDEKQALDSVKRSLSGFSHIFVDCILTGSDGIELSKKLYDLNSSKNGSGKVYLISAFVDTKLLPDDLSHITESYKKPIQQSLLSTQFKNQSVIKKFDFFHKFNNLDEVISHNLNSSYEDIEEFIPILTQTIDLTFSGKIIFMTDKSETSIINMSNGEFENITNNLEKKPFGERLLKKGYIFEDTLEDVLRSNQFKESKLKIGAYLLSKNLLSPHAYKEILKDQTIDRLKITFKYTNFKVSLLKEDRKTKSTSLNYSDYFNCLRENLDLKNSILFSLSKKELSQADKLYPTPNFELIDETKKVSLETKNLELRFLLVISGAATLQEKSGQQSDEESFNIDFIKKLLSEKDPYKTLNVRRNNITDIEVAKSYHKIAKKIHPDRLMSLNLEAENEIIFKKAFTKITEDFNKIKSTDKRKTFDTRILLNKEKEKDELNNLIKKTLEHLHKSEYLKADALLKKIESINASFSHKMLPIATLWAKLKTGKKIDLKQVSKEFFNESGSLKTALDHYILALICKRQDDTSGVLKNLERSLQIDPNFLPSRREKFKLKSELKKNHSESKKKNSSISSLFSYKKSS
jgi:curved DNA-binding protein CbpA